MEIHDLVRVATATIAFMSLVGGHYAGDQWVQTSHQACMKSLAGSTGRLMAHWNCAKHVATYSLCGLVIFLGAAWWLDLPLRPGWVAAGLVLNALTHYVVDLRTPLLWLARKAGKGGYVQHCQVMRPSGPEAGGPGTASFELDQSWHFFWIVISSLVMAGA